MQKTTIKKILLTGLILTANVQTNAAAKKNNDQSEQSSQSLNNTMAATTTYDIPLLNATSNPTQNSGSYYSDSSLYYSKSNSDYSASDSDCDTRPAPRIDSPTTFMQKNKDDHATLMYILHSKNDAQAVQAVEALMKSGKNIHFANHNGGTPLICTSAKGYINAVELLIQARANLNHADNIGYTALMCAAKNGHINAVELLIQAGAIVNHTNHNGDTALACATLNKYIEIVKLLINKRANLDTRNLVGKTPLIHAALNSYNRIIAQTLIQARANVNLADQNGDTPLIYTTINGNAQIAQALIQAGAYVNHANQSGNTPLLQTLISQSPTRKLYVNNAVLKMLIAANAKIDACNNDGANSLTIASSPKMSLRLINAYRTQLQKEYSEMLKQITFDDLKQFNKNALLQSIGDAFYQVGEKITACVTDTDRRNLVNTQCMALAKSAINGRNSHARSIKKKLFSDFITQKIQAVQALRSDPETTIDMREMYKNWETILQQELELGYAPSNGI